jgi:hypothetical protein
MGIYIAKNGKQTGPFSEEQVRGMVAGGLVSADDLAWREGDAAYWKSIRNVLGLPEAPPVVLPPAISQSQPTSSKPQKKTSGCAIIFVVVAGLFLVGYIASLTNSNPSPPPQRSQQTAEPKNDTRRWTGVQGWTVEAEYLACDNGIVRLRTAAGVVKQVPMWDLSREDQMFVVKSKGWAVVKAEREPGVNASLSVRLAERVSKDRLAAIAQELRGFADNQQPGLFIYYYLPEMQIGGDEAAWATSNCLPNLEVNILGSTKEEHEHLQREADSVTGDNVIGCWIDSERTGFPSVVTFSRESGKIFMTQVFKDGSKSKKEMVVRQVASEIRYSEIDSTTSDYLVITPDGELAHGDDQGIWTTSPKAK